MYPWTTVTISIHAPREGGDTGHRILSTQQSRFQSTPPARGATACKAALERSGVISIHAPREGGDSALNTICAPCRIFQSTPPARGATAFHSFTLSITSYFNPRPPRGGRPTRCFIARFWRYFNPRPPRGGRPLWQPLLRPGRKDFNPRPPARGATPQDAGRDGD